MKDPSSKFQIPSPKKKAHYRYMLKIGIFNFKKIVSLAFQIFQIQIDKRMPYSILKELMTADTLEFEIWDFGLGSYVVPVYLEMGSGENWLDAH